MFNPNDATRMLGISAAVLGVAVLSAACGSGSTTKEIDTPPTIAATSAPVRTPTPGAAGTETEKEQNIPISLTEWKITGPGGAPITAVEAGEVKFDVHNDGKTQHEFVLIKSDADPTTLPVEDGKINEETAGESPGEADDIDPGQAKTATMRLSAGKYVFICNVVGHYLNGMRGQLIVR